MFLLPAHTETGRQALNSCAFVSPDGAKCPETKLVARGYCGAHYKALQRAKAFLPLDRQDESIVPSSKRNIDHNARLVRRANRKLHKITPEIVGLLHESMKVAAKKGDSAAMQWALLHTRVVQPIASVNENGKGNGGVTVNIGVKVSGAKQQANDD